MAAEDFSHVYPSTFQNLLAQLEAEHRQQLSLLHRENARLLAELKQQAATTPRPSGAGEGRGSAPGSAEVRQDGPRSPGFYWLNGPSTDQASALKYADVPAVACTGTSATAPALREAGPGVGGTGANAAADAAAATWISVAAPTLEQPLELEVAATPISESILEREGHDELSGGGKSPRHLPQPSCDNSIVRAQDCHETMRPYFRQREVWSSEYVQHHEVVIRHVWRQDELLVAPNLPVERCFIEPNSNPKLAWDLTGMVLLIWDVIVIPFSLSFDPEEGWFLISMGWATLLFWTTDMVLAFFTAYFLHGHLVTSPKMICWNYLTSWFVLDLCIVGLDWFMTVASILGGEESKEGGSIVGIGRLLRGLRVTRVLRLLRLAKLRQLVQKIYDQIDTEYMFLLITMVKLMMTILFINHFVCCLWFWIGHAGSETQPHWPDGLTYAPGEPRSVERLVWDYSTSLHWSLCQFTPAGMEVVAVNTEERIFSCMVVFFAMGVFTSVVASVSASMTALRSLNEDTAKQFWLVRRYLTQNSVAMDVRMRVLRYLEHKANQESGRVKPPQILSMLSDPLRDLLESTLVERDMTAHPFLRRLHEDAERPTHLLCHHAFASVAFAAEDVVFSAGQIGESMLLPRVGAQDGDLMYTAPGQSRVAVPACDSGVFIAEPVLWTHWRHFGDLQAARPTSLLGVMPEPFAKVVRGNVKSWNMAKSYSEKYIQLLNEDNAPLSDIVVEDGRSAASRSHLSI